MPEEAVRRSRETVDAAVLAAAVGIDRAVEGDVGAVVARDDGARRVVEYRRLENVEVAEPFPAVVEGLAPLRLEAPGVIGLRATAAPALAVDDASWRRLDRRLSSLFSPQYLPPLARADHSAACGTKQEQIPCLQSVRRLRLLSGGTPCQRKP
jgi:hypothetical protein